METARTRRFVAGSAADLVNATSPRRRKIAPASVRREKVQSIVAHQQPQNARPPAEIEIVGAAAHRHVLAMIDQLACGPFDVRSRPASQFLPRFEQLDAKPSVGERGRGCQSR